MRRIITLTMTVALVSTVAVAQMRYIDEVFPGVTVIKDQLYSVNITVATGQPALDTLRYDLYMPTGDTCTTRPLAVVLHTGTFLPRGLFAPTGAKDDSANVWACRRLAMRGFVAASIEYRVGWNPIAPDDTIRRSTIINAAYRSIQDMYAFIRYMHVTVSMGNPYQVDMDRVAIMGIGTGGFVNLNAAVLTQDEIYIDKFRSPISGIPFIDTLLVGDLHGVKPGLINIPNHAGYPDDFHFVFSLDGAIGDSSWIEDGNSVPIVAAGTVTHPTTPYGIDPDDPTMINCDLPVTTGAGTGVYVVNIAGTVCVLSKANSLGINNPLSRCQSYNDPISEAVRNNANGFGQEHLWPINLPGPQAGPWEFWDSTFWDQVPSPVPGFSVHEYALLLNPDMSMEKANAYLDTAVWLFAPRAYAALKLDEIVCSCEGVNQDPLVVNDFECQRNYPFGAGADKICIINNPMANTDNGSEKVGAYADPPSDPWAALCVNYGGSIDLSTYNRFEFQVNSAANVPVLVKLEGGMSPAYETWLSTNAAGTWETLEADFSSQAAEDHARVCIFMNGGVDDPAEYTYNLDNLHWAPPNGVFNPVVPSLVISPNPVENVLYIRNPGKVEQFRLVNTLGQLVLNQHATGQDIETIMMRDLHQGIYLLTAFDAQGKLIGKARIVKK